MNLTETKNDTNRKIVSLNKTTTEYPNGKLYTYSNGLRVFHATKAKNSKDVFYVDFLSGAKAQGGTQGLAHFVEHLMFRDCVLKKICGATNGSTSENRISFYIERKNKFGEEPPKIDVKDKTNEQLEYEEKHKKEKSNRRIVMTNFLHSLIDEIQKEDWDSENPPLFTKNEFENEKEVIDNEFNQRAFGSFDLNYLWNLYSCGISEEDISGNYKTLKNTTIEDVNKFKKENFTQENAIIYIDSSLNYNDFEKYLLKEINRLPQKGIKNTFCFYASETQNEGYYINSREIEGTKTNKISFNLTVNRKDIDFNSYIIGQLLFSHYGKSYFLKHYRSDFRANDAVGGSYIYSTNALEERFNKFVCSLSVTNFVQSNKIRNFLITNARVFNSITNEEFLTNGQVDENFIAFKKRFSNKQTLINLACTDFMRSFTSQELEKTQELLNNLTYEDAKKYYKTYVENMKLNIIIDGDVKLEELPSFNFIKDITTGKNPDILQYAKNMKEESFNHQQKYLHNLNIDKNRALVVYDDKEQSM